MSKLRLPSNYYYFSNIIQPRALSADTDQPPGQIYLLINYFTN